MKLSEFMNNDYCVKVKMFNILIALVLLSGCYSQNGIDSNDEYDNIQEVISNLTKIHENPNIYTDRQLLETGILYLDKLSFLVDEVKSGIPKAERLIRTLHKERAFEQLVNAPVSLLAKTYKWNSLQIGEYENIIHRAKQIWNYFLDEIHYGSFGQETTTPDYDQMKRELEEVEFLSDSSDDES